MVHNAILHNYAHMQGLIPSHRYYFICCFVMYMHCSLEVITRHFHMTLICRVNNWEPFSSSNYSYKYDDWIDICFHFQVCKDRILSQSCAARNASWAVMHLFKAIYKQLKEENHNGHIQPRIGGAKCKLWSTCSVLDSYLLYACAQATIYKVNVAVVANLVSENLTPAQIFLLRSRGSNHPVPSSDVRSLCSCRSSEDT